jgi:hypothetical protein
MTAPEATNKEGGVIIMVAGLADGHRGSGFYNNLARSKSLQEFLDRVAKTDRNHHGPGPVGVANLGAYPVAPPGHHDFRPGEAGTRNQHAHEIRQDVWRRLKARIRD